MSTRQILAAAAAGIHLILVMGGAANISLPRWSGVAGSGIRWYAALSGADSGYGFFAPGVASETRATFTLTDGAGRTWTEEFNANGNQEVQLRLGSMVSTAASPGIRRKLAASWAGKFFAIHPEVESVLVQVEYYDLPPMDEYQDGERPEWVTEYEVEFFRNEATPHEVNR
jgi:hypothetical protein